MGGGSEDNLQQEKPSLQPQTENPSITVLPDMCEPHYLLRHSAPLAMAINDMKLKMTSLKHPTASQTGSALRLGEI